MNRGTRPGQDVREVTQGSSGGVCVRERESKWLTGSFKSQPINPHKHSTRRLVQLGTKTTHAHTYTGLCNGTVTLTNIEKNKRNLLTKIC